jgi:hypothetical protein
LLRRLIGLRRLLPVIDIAFHDAQQFIQGEIDAVVGQAAGGNLAQSACVNLNACVSE